MSAVRVVDRLAVRFGQFIRVIRLCTHCGDAFWYELETRQICANCRSKETWPLELYREVHG